jgi:hypothetical protein
MFTAIAFDYAGLVNDRQFRCNAKEFRPLRAHLISGSETPGL